MQEDSVNQLKSVCDGKMEKIHVIGRQIAENPDITGFMEYETTQSGESKLAIQSVFKYLQAQMANENCISDIFIFSRKSRYLISPRQASNEMGPTALIMKDILTEVKKNYGKCLIILISLF